MIPPALAGGVSFFKLSIEERTISSVFNLEQIIMLSGLNNLPVINNHNHVGILNV